MNKDVVQYDDSSNSSSYKNLTALIAVARMMDIYSNDDFEEKNLEKAFSFYKIICNSRSLDDTINTSCERMKKIANQISNPEFEQAEKLAKKGKATYQYNLGVIYDKQKDTQKSFYWYEKAAQLNSTSAIYHVGLYYYHGYGVQKDVDKGIKYIREAKDKGYKRAENFFKLNNIR